MSGLSSYFEGFVLYRCDKSLRLRLAHYRTHASEVLELCLALKGPEIISTLPVRKNDS